jgi:HTH-type transcriptional regulator/antitoxin HigA
VNYSGRFLMRVPRHLHAELARHAKRQGVSLNQYVLYLLAARQATDAMAAGKSKRAALSFMELKPIKTKAEYKAALREIKALFDVPDKTPEADRLEVLVMLVEKYEAQHYHIPAPDPIDFLNYAMKTRGLTRKDLGPYIGSRGRVAEVRNPARLPSR